MNIHLHRKKNPAVELCRGSNSEKFTKFTPKSAALASRSMNKHHSKMANFLMRPAKEEDCDEIIRLIQVCLFVYLVYMGGVDATAILLSLLTH